MLQSALREMQVLGRSGRLWLTFGAVVLLFAVTGPYGTAEKLAVLPRLAFWLLLHAGAWFFALTFSIIAEVILRHVVRRMFVRMLIGSLVATLPIGLVIGISELSWFGVPLTWSGYFAGLPATLPLTAIFCTISYLAMSGETQPVAAPVQAPPVAEPRPNVPLLARLSIENRGALQLISVEDHYCRIRTSRGSELILLRFSDALKETGTTEGMQVHRSHWVARDFANGLRMQDGRLVLSLKDGTDLPVSRSHAARVRDLLSRNSRGEEEKAGKSA
jgi:DNA-binding LytR/AlgR family response regulator